ncbi:MAG: hypothetical protein HC892_05555 [Saprospiraceae bacterium]|nr:hypothetical protein [Saprospiraceae bacterium]
MLYSLKQEANKGINYANYHYHLQDSSVEGFQKYLEETEKEKVELKEADNGNYYLPKGNYVITIKKGTSIATTKLVIE